MTGSGLDNRSSTGAVLPSYASGTSATRCWATPSGPTWAGPPPRVPGHEALVDVPSGRRWTYARAGGRRRRPGHRPAGARASRPGTGSGSGLPTAPNGRCSSTPRASVGAILVTINPAYRTHELEFVLHQAGVETWSRRRLSRRRTTERWSPRCGRAAPGCARSTSSARPAWDESGRDGRRRGAPGRGGGGACRPTTRSTSSTPRARRDSPRAPRSATTTS